MVIIVTNCLTVSQAHAIDFEDRFRKRVHLVDNHPGFLRNEVQRPSPIKFSHANMTWVKDETQTAGTYRVSTWWKTFDDFQNWTKSSDFALAHSQKSPEGMFAGPAMLEVHEVFLSTDLTADGELKRVERGSHLHLPADTNLYFDQNKPQGDTEASWRDQRGSKL